MNKYLHYIILAGMAVMSCNKTETDMPFAEPAPDAQPATVQMTFTGIAETGTKTSLDAGTGNVSWVAGDKVKFIYEVDKTPGEAISDGITLNGSHASITASVPATFGEKEFTGSSRHLYAVYPSTVSHEYGTNLYVTVPSIQDGSFEKAAIALAKWDKEHPTAALEFKNLCGLLQFTITDNSVRKIVLSASENIAGKMQITFKDGAPVVLAAGSGESTITVNVPGAGTYYIGVLPNTLSSLYVALYDGSDNLLGDRMADTDVTIARRQIRKLGTLSPGFGDRYFVKAGGAGTKDGSSWDNAADITALNAKLVSNNSTLHVFMAAGTYSPSAQQAMGTANTDANVTIQGGFPANATGYVLTGRNLSANATILDGGGDKRIWILQRGKWSISGITFQNACRASGTSDTGSALVIEGDASSSFTLRDCIFSSNKNLGTKSTSGGGAVRVSNAHASFTRCAFIGNQSCYFGGAMYLNGTASVLATDCTFSLNEETTNDGGAVYVNGGTTLTLSGCTFTDNTAKRNGGAIVIRTNGTVVANDCTFGEKEHPNKTTSAQGGAIYINSNGTLTATNCAFAYNSAATMGGAIESNGGTFNATGCTFKGNTSTTDGASIVTAGASTIKLNQCILSDNVATKSTADLYIGGTTTLYANACYFGQSDAGATIATGSDVPHRILSGNTAHVGFNNCVISGPFGKTNQLTQLRGNSILVNTTLYSQVGGAVIQGGSSDADGCRVINCVVLNNSSSKYAFNVESERNLQAYNTVYGLTTGEGTLTPTDCVTGKYNAATLDENAFPDNNPWAQKSLGSAVKLPSGGTIKAYGWDGVCDGFTNASLSDIKTLISGTSGVGAGFREWLESEDLKVNGKEALAVDIRGVARNTSAMWPGSYEK